MASARFDMKKYYQLDGKSITQVELEARELGLSYGEYVSGKQVEPKAAAAAYARAMELRRAENARKKAAERRVKARMEAEGKTEAKPKKRGGGMPTKAVEQLDIYGNVVDRFESLIEAAAVTGTKVSNICMSCKRYDQLVANGITPSFKLSWRYAAKTGAGTDAAKAAV